MTKRGFAAALFALAALAFVSAAGADTNITDRPYVRHDGGTDTTIAACNSDAPANSNAPFAVPDYEFTTIVSRGTPSPIFRGHFEDKIELETDDGVASPFQNNVYVCWARFTGSGVNNFIEFARSTDGGRTWRVQKISEAIHGVQGCDIAVTRT